MKILLVAPNITTFGTDTTDPGLTPPLGLCYLAGYLRKKDSSLDISILDCIAASKKRKIRLENGNRWGLTDQEIISKIKEKDPEIIGITCSFTSYAYDVHHLASLIKQTNRKTKVIIGGAHASIYPDILLKDKNIDVVVKGEGELTFLELITNLKNNKSVENIKGTIIRSKDKIKINPPREMSIELDELPFPARDLIPMDLYLSQKSEYSMRHPYTQVITSRGCPGICKFCSIHSVWGHKWKMRSPKNIVDEVQMLVKDYGVKEVHFIDDNIGASPKRLEEICDEIIRRNLKIKWATPNGIAHWTLNKKILKKMKKAGCYRITFGIESADPETRKFIGKPYNLDQAKDMLKEAHKLGIWTVCTFILGFPYETKESIMKTIDFAKYKYLDFGIYYLLGVFPGTPIYDIYKKEGLLNFDHLFYSYNESKWSQYEKISKVLSSHGTKSKNLSEEQLREYLALSYKVTMKATLRKFINPFRLMTKINSLEDVRYVLKLFKNYSNMIQNYIVNKGFHVYMIRKKKK
ncbi:radical SAM protein [Candidatus Woesearchaeota archaeon]|nr:radical SAM protein [Candidatus Woesearchaeota archaeon]